ncbi:hypothetical protein EDC01DRAFT_703450 [Geopyxis carbonaria]|nr:hypothetical protein EDC01DRAFT_703450 [Geopyxis carbonaria]
MTSPATEPFVATQFPQLRVQTWSALEPAYETEPIPISKAHRAASPAVLRLAWALVLRAYTGLEQVSGVVETADGTYASFTSTFAGTDAVQAALSKFSVPPQAADASTAQHSTCLSLTSTPAPLQPRSCALALAITPESAFLHYSTHLLHRVPAADVATAFATILAAVLDAPTAAVDSLPLVAPDVVAEITREKPAPAVQSTFPALLAETTAVAPTAQAVHAFDGRSLTYAELDTLTAKVAALLRARGVGPEVLVPVCFDKTLWAVVALLGVMRAGGAFVPIDPALPVERGRRIVDDVWKGMKGGRLIICGSTQEAVCRELGGEVIVLDNNTVFDDEATAPTDRLAAPYNTAYIIYTSGSTGMPKGVVVPHISLATASTAQRHQGVAGFGPTSRVLQFSSLSFDASIYEILFTLHAGGCVCIPSPASRRGELASAIRELGANYLILTPSVASLLAPADMPGVRTLMVGGEQMARTVLQTWCHGGRAVAVVNGYGPTETTVVAVVNEAVHKDTDLGNIGRPVGCVVRLVSPTDHTRFVPPGAVGELVIAGPVVTRGYLHDAAKTAAVFVASPEPADKRTRWYKTGDLARWGQGLHSDLICLGRKDQQKKLRGQRLELGEIEVHLRECLGARTEIAVDIARGQLVAFVAAPATTKLDAGMVEVHRRLAETLPGYMVPTAWLRVDALPMSIAAKVDRKALIALAEASPSPLLPLGRDPPDDAAAAYVPPATDTEATLQRVWATALELAPSDVSVVANFFTLGGNSLASMTLVSRARAAGLVVDPGAVFSHPTVRAMAAVAAPVPAPSSSARAYTPFSLLPDVDVSALARAVRFPGVTAEDVEDVLPCLDLQAQAAVGGLMPIPGLYGFLTLSLTGAVDVARLQAVFQLLVDTHPVLRTIFVPYNGRILQLVLRRLQLDTEVVDAGDAGVDEAAKGIWMPQMAARYGLGERLLRLWIVRGAGETRVLFRCTQAHWDGAAIATISAFLRTHYAGSAPPPAPAPSMGPYLSEGPYRPALLSHQVPGNAYAYPAFTR